MGRDRFAIEPEEAAPPRSDGATASQTTVSAPSSGVRRIPFVAARKRGSELRTAGVSAHPGCIAKKVTPSFGCRSAHSSFRTTRARFVRAY